MSRVRAPVLAGKSTAQLFATILVVIVLAPFATAGTVTNPEIVDPANDGWDFINEKSRDVAALDIQAAWIEPVSSDQLEFGIKVRDLVDPTSAGAFKDNSNAHVWGWDFTIDDVLLRIDIYQDIQGDHFAEMRAPGRIGDGLPATHRNSVPCAGPSPASLEFDTSADTIIFAVERQFTFRENAACATQPGTAQHDFDLGDGTSLTNVWLETLECRPGDVQIQPDGTAVPSCTGFENDRTSLAQTFEFDSSLSNNRHLVVRPASNLHVVPAEGTATITAMATNPTGLKMDTTISMVAPTGWTITPAERKVELPAGASKQVTFSAKPGANAAPGIATMGGGAVANEILLTVGSATVPKFDANRPALGTLGSQDATFYLFGNPGVAADGTAGTSADLIDFLAQNPDAVEISRTPDGVTPFGTWASDPMRGSMNLLGDATLSVRLDWSGSDALEVVALLGANVPLNWDGATALPGIAVLNTATDGTADGSGTYLLSGPTAGVKLPPGEELELALFVIGNGGTVFLTPNDETSPNSLSISYTQPIIGASIVPLAGGKAVASLATATPLPQNDAASASIIALGGAKAGTTSTAIADGKTAGSMQVHRAVLSEFSGEGEVPLTLSAAGTQLATVNAIMTAQGPTMAPVALFTPSAAAAHVGTALTFIDNSFDPEGALASWAWDFGDGAISSAKSPTHRFSADGTYVVSLVVTDAYEISSPEHFVTMTIVPQGTALPDGGAPPNPGSAVPATGAMGYYRGLYTTGTGHEELYGAEWALAELDGTIGAPYLSAPGGAAASIFGTSIAPKLAPEWIDGALSVGNHLGAVTTTNGLDVTHGVANRSITVAAPSIVELNGEEIDISGMEAWNEDDGSSGRILATTKTLEQGGVQATRSLSLLQGTTHSDVRTTIIGGAEDALTIDVTSTIPAPPGSWIAYGLADSIQVLAIAESNGQTVPIVSNGWVAIFDPESTEVAGAVFAGDIEGITLGWADDELTITALYASTGELVAAQYLGAYMVGDQDATRYAGIMEVARQDASEVGVATLTGKYGAGVGWAGADARVDPAGGGAPGLVGLFLGTPEEWIVEVEAEADQTGKAVRFILPSSASDGDGVQVYFDDATQPLELADTKIGDAGYVITAPVPEFSVHSLRLQSSEPAVSPFVPWVGLVAAIALVSIASVVVRRQVKK